MRYYLSITSKFIFTITVFFSFLNVYGQENEQYTELVKEASHFYELKNYKQSVENYLKAFKIFEKNSSDLYNAACSAALNNNAEKAKVFLISAIENGWTDADHLQKDPDLYQLHCLADWAEIVKKVKEVEENSISQEALIDNVESLIMGDKAASIYELTTDTFRATITIEELEITINSIHNLLEENNIKSWKSIRMGTSSSISFVNGLKTESFYHDYRIKPNYLDGKAKSNLIRPRGYNIRIEVSKERNSWYLSNLIFENEYNDLNYDMNTQVHEFFKESDSLVFRYSLAENNQVLYNQGIVKSDSVKNEVTAELMNFQFIPFSELKDYGVFKKSGKIYSLSFSFYSKKKERKVAGWLNNVIRKSDIYIVEFMFDDKDSNLLLVSNNEKYGFFKVKSTEQLKEIVLKSFTNITK